MAENSEVILIKLGGSIITNKKSETPALNETVVEQLCQEISQARVEIGAKIILGHGAGSFAHPPAAKHRTIEGILDETSLMGASEVKIAMTQISTLMIERLFQAGLPAICLPPMAFITAEDKQLGELFPSVIVNLLKAGLLPVTHGDVVSDSKLGFTIFSGEQILNWIALRLPEFGLTPKLIIEVGETDGVYNNMEDKRVIPVINESNFLTVEQGIKGSSSTDVTGGMIHKVKEAYDLARKGVPTLLISATPGNLKKAILGEEVAGTWIR